MARFGRTRKPDSGQPAPGHPQQGYSQPGQPPMGYPHQAPSASVPQFMPPTQTASNQGPGYPSPGYAGNAHPGNAHSNNADRYAPELEPDTERVLTSTRTRASSTKAIAMLLWAAVFGGLVLGLINFVSAPTTATPDTTQTKAAAAPEQPPIGCAELAIKAWLIGDADSLQRLIAETIPSLPKGKRTAQNTYAVDARPVAGQNGVWVVTVAAEVTLITGEGTRPAGTQYFQLPMIKDGSGGGCLGWVGTAMPAQVAGPMPHGDIKLDYNAHLQDLQGSLGGTVRNFLLAYLCGTGDISRYLASGTKIYRIVPATVTGVELNAIRVNAPGANVDDSQVPNNVEWKILVSASTTNVGETEGFPVTYALTVVAKDGQWYVKSFDSGPQLQAPTASGAIPSQEPGAPASPSVPAHSVTPSNSQTASNRPSQTPSPSGSNR